MGPEIPTRALPLLLSGSIPPRLLAERTIPSDRSGYRSHGLQTMVLWH